jgi:DNA-binding NtrC family response regulator
LFRKFVIDFAERYKTTPVQLDDAARELLINYPFRGNVRELKNLAEQISVLAADKQVGARELSQFLPDNAVSRMPVLASGGAGSVSQQEFASEREILYKLFFDMKKDVTELKRVLFEMVQNPGMAQQSFMKNTSLVPDLSNGDYVPTGNVSISPMTGNSPVTFVQNDDIHQHEEVEDDLNIMHMEKAYILRALKKHKSKRRDAALDLGISERTLYRKLKEYDIEDA